MSEYTDDIEAFMLKDNLEGVIRYLKILPNISGDAKNKLLALHGRLTKLESDQVLGVLSQAEYSKERNQIRFGIIQVSTKFESKINKIEEEKAKKQKALILLKKNTFKGSIVLIIAFLFFKGFNYISYINNINIPFTYVGSAVNKENLKGLYQMIQSDSTLGSKHFNQAIKFLYTASLGREKYGELNGYDSSYVNSLITSDKFDYQINTFFSDLDKDKITFDKIFKEIEYETKLREEILYDTIQNRYKEIDRMCVEIQQLIDKKIEISESIKKNVKVELFNVNINKAKKRLEARSTIRNGTGLTLYSVKSRIHICDFKTRDTLTTIMVSVDQPTGIDAVYTQSLDFYSYWNQPSIYNAIKNYKINDFYYQNQIWEVNVEGENYELWFEDYSINLPYDGFYYRNRNYETPEELVGKCPYLLYSNKTIEKIRQSINNLILKKLEESGFHFLEYLDRLEITS